MPRFFVTPEKVSDGIITIDNSDVSHITRVLRLNCGDEIEVCDSAGNDYKALIKEVGARSVICTVQSVSKTSAEPDIFVTLYQGIPKGSKMDYIIQKTTELGISRIVPVMMERCVVKLENEKAELKKTERWGKIAEEAAKQSGRGIIPEVTKPVAFSKALEMLCGEELAFAPYECENMCCLKPVLDRGRGAKTAGFIIGPEGGFDPAEAQKLAASGISTVTLGRRILRTETAGEAVLSMLMYEIGDINRGNI